MTSLLTLCRSDVCRGVEQTAGPSSLICQSLTLLSREQVMRCRSVTHAAPNSQSLWPCAQDNPPEMSQRSHAPASPANIRAKAMLHGLTSGSSLTIPSLLHNANLEQN